MYTFVLITLDSTFDLDEFLLVFPLILFYTSTLIEDEGTGII